MHYFFSACKFFFTCILLGSIVSIAYAVTSDKGNNTQLPPAATQVDLKLYSGKWYELASVPTIFQKGCRCTTADYELTESYLAVKNTCVKDSNNIVVKLAKAYPVEGSHNKQFKIEFFKPFKHDYWIDYVNQDYQYAIVGTPNKKRIWLLARQPTISAQQYQLLKDKALSDGYVLEHLKNTDQRCYKPDSQ